MKRKRIKYIKTEMIFNEKEDENKMKTKEYA